MRNLAVPLALALILAACASPAAPQPPPTITSTPSPSATPAPTLTPTSTPDPNMPKAATGRDANGRYFATENGKTYYFLPEVFGDKEFESQMKAGPIDLTPIEDSAYGSMTLDLNVFAEKGFALSNNIKHLVKPAALSQYATKDQAWASPGSYIMESLCIKQDGLTRKTWSAEYNHFKTDADRSRWFAHCQHYVPDLNSGAIVDLNGMQWQPRKGYDVYWIGEAEAKADPSMYYANDVYSKVTVVDGKLIAIMATRSQEVFKENMFFHVLLAPLQAATQGVSQDIWWMQYQDLGGRVAAGVTANGVRITTSTIDLVP